MRIEDIAEKLELSRTAVLYRIKQMETRGDKLSENYQRGKRGAVRVYTDKDLKKIINYQAKKPGRKRKDG